MEQLFYIFCIILPIHIIPFSLFWNFRWRSRTAALALVTVNVLCKMAVAAYCSARHRLVFESRLLEAQITEQKKHSQLIIEHMAEMQRHDMHHQFTPIRGLAGADNPQLGHTLTVCWMPSPPRPKHTAKIRRSTPSSPTTPHCVRNGV